MAKQPDEVTLFEGLYYPGDRTPPIGLPDFITYEVAMYQDGPIMQRLKVKGWRARYLLSAYRRSFHA